MAGTDERWPVQLDIIGPAQPIPEHTSFTFRSRMTYDDDSTSIVESEWLTTSKEFGSITPQGVFTAGEVPAGTRSVEVRASHLDVEKDLRLNASLIVLVKDTSTPPTVVSLHIEGPAEVPKNSDADYVVKARYNNGEYLQVSPTSLTSSRPAVASININGHATFHALRGSATVSFTATYTIGGNTFTAQTNVLVVDSSIYPVRGNVFGPSIITENGKAQFGFNVVFENGSNQQVIATWFSSNPKAGTLDCKGNFCASAVDGVETTTIIATYEYEGTVTSASLELSVLDITVYPKRLTIEGPENIREGLVVQYYTTVHFSNGTRKAVLADLTANTTAGRLDAGHQFYAASQVDVPTQVALLATYENLQTQRFVEVIPSPVKPVSAYIELRSPMYVGEYQSLKFHVVYEDGLDIILPALWALSNNHIATVSESGVLHAIQVMETAELVVTATTKISGVELKANLPVTLIDNKTFPLSVSIDGPQSIRVGVDTSYSAAAVFSDGSSRNVSPLWYCADERVTVLLGRVKATAPGTYHLSVSYTLQHETVIATKEITVS